MAAGVLLTLVALERRPKDFIGSQRGHRVATDRNVDFLSLEYPVSHTFPFLSCRGTQQSEAGTESCPTVARAAFGKNWQVAEVLQLKGLYFEDCWKLSQQRHATCLGTQPHCCSTFEGHVKAYPVSEGFTCLNCRRGEIDRCDELQMIENH